MVVGEGFKGIVRTLRVLNWPKLDIHYRGSYLVDDQCQRYGSDKGCGICSPKYKDGTCFPNCELDESPSIDEINC